VWGLGVGQGKGLRVGRTAGGGGVALGGQGGRAVRTGQGGRAVRTGQAGLCFRA
jgi:hypothetical protein